MLEILRMLVFILSYYETPFKFQGEKLKPILTKDDVIILVGTHHCNVTSIAEEQLTCRPPPADAEGLGSSPSVNVSMKNHGPNHSRLSSLRYLPSLELIL